MRRWWARGLGCLKKYWWRALDKEAWEKLWVEVRDCLNWRSFGDTVRGPGVTVGQRLIQGRGTGEWVRSSRGCCVVRVLVCPSQRRPLGWRWGQECRWRGRWWARSLWSQQTRSVSWGSVAEGAELMSSSCQCAVMMQDSEPQVLGQDQGFEMVSRSEEDTSLTSPQSTLRFRLKMLAAWHGTVKHRDIDFPPKSQGGWSLSPLDKVLLESVPQ